MSRDGGDDESYAAAERRGAALVATLQGRWNFTTLASSIFLAMCVPFFITPADLFTSKDEWSTTIWFPSVYGVLWAGAVLHALFTLIASVLLSNIVASAHAADAEEVLAALGERQIVASLCGRRARLPVLTSALEALLLVATLGTSGFTSPTILLAPFAFFRPCLVFFLLATGWSVYWTLPAAAFGFFVATAALCMCLVVSMAGTAIGIVEEHSSALPKGRVRLAIHGVVRGSSSSSSSSAKPPPTAADELGLAETLLVQ